MNRSSDPNVPLMEPGSVVQPGRQFFLAVKELAGFIEIPEQPTVTAGYADIYRGFWTNPQGERVQVAIKQLKTIPKDRRTDQEALKWRADMPRLISPWCHHGNLTDYLRANLGLTRCEKLRLIFQTACGLEHLHSRTPPICHADIKPENVLINDQNCPALSDFGLSRVVQELEAGGGFTTSETVGGTLRYMASELSAGQKPDLESDVYAFGGLILTVMSGKAPFDGLPLQVILRRVMQDQPPIPKDHPNLPAHDPLWELMCRCWNNARAARPKMREVRLEFSEQITRGESYPLPWQQQAAQQGNAASPQTQPQSPHPRVTQVPSPPGSVIPAQQNNAQSQAQQQQHYYAQTQTAMLRTAQMQAARQQAIAAQQLQPQQQQVAQQGNTASPQTQPQSPHPGVTQVPSPPGSVIPVQQNNAQSQAQQQQHYYAQTQAAMLRSAQRQAARQQAMAVEQLQAQQQQQRVAQQGNAASPQTQPQSPHPGVTQVPSPPGSVILAQQNNAQSQAQQQPHYYAQTQATMVRSAQMQAARQQVMLIEQIQAQQQQAQLNAMTPNAANFQLQMPANAMNGNAAGMMGGMNGQQVAFRFGTPAQQAYIQRQQQLALQASMVRTLQLQQQQQQGRR